MFTLRGEWKIRRDLALEFVMRGSNKKTRRITFRTQLTLTKNNRLSFVLSNHKNQPLGIKVIFDHNNLSNSVLRIFLESKDLRRLAKIGFKKSFQF